MRGSVGDRIVVASNRIDHAVRDGRIVEVRHEDGSPPYVVEWSDTGQRATVFPGPDARIEHLAGTPEQRAGEAPEAEEQPRRIKTWRIEVHVVEGPEQTTAEAVLTAPAPESFEGRGRARLHPGEEPVPIIGDEVAVGRALHRLADRLLDAASEDLEQRQGAAAHPEGTSGW